MQNPTRNLLAVLCVLIIAFSASSQQTQPSIKLLGLAVEGNVRTDGGLIIATSGLVIGENLTGEKIQRAIRQLWELEQFSDIKIVAEQVTSQGAYLLIRVIENPRLEVIDIGGAKKIGRDEVEEIIAFYKGQVLRRSDPVKARRKIEKLCEEKGYLLTEIIVEVRDGSSENLKKLYIRINEGEKVKIKNISFEGNEVYSDKRLRKILKTKQKALFRSGEFHRDKFDEDMEKLIGFYREHGYRDAHITGDSISYTEDRRRMLIKVFIEEGRKYYFGDITFTGSDLFSEDELRRTLLFGSGEVFNQTKYDISIKDGLSTLFYDKGYIYSQIRAAEIPTGQDTLDIAININAGSQFSVRRIHITGNEKTRENVIRREFSIKPGDTFDVTKLRRSMRDVTILNFFANVVPDVEDISDKEVDLWIKVEEKPTDQANLSIGYSEQDGMIGAIGFTAPNLYGTGQRVNFDWNFGQDYGSFSLSYTEPWLFDTETLVGASFYNVRRRWSDGFTENLIGGSARLGKRLPWPDDYFRGEWIYSLERSKYYDFTDQFAERTDTGISENEVRWSSSITQVISRDSRDYPEFPTSGSVATLTNEFAGGILMGDDQFHKHTMSVEWYTPVFKKVVLYNQFLFGILGGLTKDDDDIPLLEHFFMGGSGLSIGVPLRGYNERQVGTFTSSSSTASGGKSMMKVCAEMRIQLVDNPTIYGLAFAEAGNTWLTFNQTDPFNLKRSVGLGIRLYMPLIGLIGLDYGYGLDYYQDGRRKGMWKPHFQFGRTF